MTEEKIFEKIGKSAIVIFLGTVLGSGLNFLTRVLIARSFDPSHYGLFSMGFAALTAAGTLSLLGLREGVARWISYFLGQKGKIKGVIYSALKISLPLSILVSCLLFYFAERISLLMGEASLTPILKTFSFAIPLLVVLDIFVASIRGLQNSKYKVYTYDVFWPSLRVFLVALVILLGYSLPEVVAVHVLAILLTAFLSFYLLLKLFPWQKTSQIKFPCKKLLFFSWPLMVSSILFLLVTWLGIFMLGYFKDAFQVGVYTAALPAASSLIFVLFSFNYLFLPKSSQLYSQKKEKEIKNIYSKVVWWIFILTLPLFLLMLIFPQEILAIFGSKYVEGAVALSILALGYFYASSVGPTGNVLISMGKTKQFMFIFLTIAGLDFLFNWLLIPTWGYVGAAISLSLAFIIGWSLSLILIYRELKAQPFSWKFFKILLLASLLSVPFLLSTLVMKVSIFILIAESLIYVFLYALILAKLFFKAQLDHFLSLLKF